MLGAILALLSALAFSSNAILVRRGVVLATPGQIALITVVMGVPLFFVAALVTGQLFRLPDLSASGYGFLAAGGVINFIIGRLFNYKAIEAIGAARTAPFQALTLPYSVIVAFIFLDEAVSAGTALGVMLIMIGPLILVERRTRQPVAPATPPGEVVVETVAFQPRQLEGYVYALLAAAAYGTSPILFRAALEGSTGLSVAGALVAYCAAALVMVTGIALAGQVETLRSVNPRTLRVFFGAGFSVFLAQVLRFLALSLAPVAVVISLERMNSVFTLLLSWRLNRTLERITVRVVAGVMTSATGALILLAALS